MHTCIELRLLTKVAGLNRLLGSHPLLLQIYNFSYAAQIRIHSKRTRDITKIYVYVSIHIDSAISG